MSCVFGIISCDGYKAMIRTQQRFHNIETSTLLYFITFFHRLACEYLMKNKQKQSHAFVLSVNFLLLLLLLFCIFINWVVTSESSYQL